MSLTGPAPTYGAQAGDVLSSVMGVHERPADNDFVEVLEQYMDLVAGGEGESNEGRALRRKLDAISPDDPDLDRADMEIRRRRIMERRGKAV